MKRLIILLFLLLPTGWVLGQVTNRSVSGIVSDSLSGAKLENVSIVVAGRTGGTTTDQDGTFTLKGIQYPALLYFSHLGYGVHSLYLDKAPMRKLEVLLNPEVQVMDAVAIRGQVVQKVIREDTLDILDYEVIDDGFLLLGNPYKLRQEMNLYLTNWEGQPKYFMPIQDAGKMIKYPEIRVVVRTFLFKDFTGNIRLLTKKKVWEVDYSKDSISLKYPEQYPDFLRYVLPMKCEMAGALYYQVSSKTKNTTLWQENAFEGSRELKTVIDPFGAGRYITFSHKSHYKYVSAPIYRIGNEIAIFDFFDSHIEFFDRSGTSKRKTPIVFQNTTRREFLAPDYQDIDQYNFTQQVIFDELTQKAYAFFRIRSSGVQTLREIDLDTGEIVRIIEIPDLPNISKLRVNNNRVFFLYDAKLFPYNRSLYRMAI